MTSEFINIKKTTVVYTSAAMVIVTIVSGIYVKLFWNDILDGEPLPIFTHIGIYYGFLVPLLAAIILHFDKSGQEIKKSVNLVTVITIIELLSLGFIGLTYYLPSLYITWNMG